MQLGPADWPSAWAPPAGASSVPPTLYGTRSQGSLEKGLKFARKQLGHLSDNHICCYTEPTESELEQALDAPE